MHATIPQPLFSLASTESACINNTSPCLVNLISFVIMQSSGGHRSRSWARSSPSATRRRPHHDSLPRPGETDDDRRRRVTAARRQRDTVTPGFMPRRCRLCGERQTTIYTSRTGLCQHAKEHHRSWYHPRDDQFIRIPDDVLAATRQRVAEGTARPLHSDPANRPQATHHLMHQLAVTTTSTDDRRRRGRCNSPFCTC